MDDEKHPILRSRFSSNHHASQSWLAQIASFHKAVKNFDMANIGCVVPFTPPPLCLSLSLSSQFIINRPRGSTSSR